MKSLLTIVTKAIAITAIVAFAGCQKTASDLTFTKPGGTAATITSFWFQFSTEDVYQSNQSQNGINPQLYNCFVNAPELTQDMLASGKVLVFAEFGGVEASILALPAQNIGVGIREGRVTVTCASLNTLTATRFRLILIPQTLLAKAPDFDYTDYDALVAYYHLQP